MGKENHWAEMIRGKEVERDACDEEMSPGKGEWEDEGERG